MQLSVETWFAQQEFGREPKDLFAEATLCYKAGAHRAALILGYLAFQTVVRDRILAATAPTGIQQGQWSSIQKSLRQDDKWDAATYDAIQQQKPASIFRVSDDIRQQVAFWKNRRNDAAHAKTNALSHSHVEAFWLFAQSVLPRLVVSGSRAALLLRIQQHFDPSVTPTGQPIQPLVAEIGSAVDPSEVDDFFGEVHAYFLSRPKKLFQPYPPEGTDFFAAALLQGDKQVSARAAALLSTDVALLTTVLRKHPTTASRLVSFPKAIRKTWHDELFKGGRDDFEVLTTLIATGAIPVSEVEECLKRIARVVPDNLPSAACDAILKQHGFYGHLKEYAFDERAIDEFEWANGHTALVGHCLQQVPIDDAVVNALAAVFNKPNHPFDLRDALNAFFATHKTERQAVIDGLQQLSLPLPAHLSSLS